ncbi:hypothetical protein [Methylobacterium iners]|uniref:Uncharacterized protein n=1 Tax=Methylobacterium iners TaxID=418707 RepID=A0ABQ4RRU3_9HYPH|nr:hypothetical protein [Methylobacterium iners]GJD92902.1 hypothetical protein OCOJLMKI_0085 [Methylobacterium iners]
MAVKAAESPLLLSISAVRKRKPSAERRRDPRGDRYNPVGAYTPGVGLARGPQAFGIGTPIDQPKKRIVVTLKDDSVTAAVADPYEPGKRIQATVNRRVDVLEHERANGRITVSQYETARQVQAIFEKASGARNTGDVDYGDVRISDPSRRPETLDLDFIRAISNAREVQALMRRVHAAIGETPAHFLRELLCRGGTIKDYVRSKDMLASDRKVTEIAVRFRYLLEVLDEAFAARGLVVKDENGDRVIRAEVGTATGEETDERGRVVPAGHGHLWGRHPAEDTAE